MNAKTASEVLFESFCDFNAIHWEPVPVAGARTPDYLLRLAGDHAVYVELKQIDSDDAFRPPGGISSRTVGSHVRRKIGDSKGQLQLAKRHGLPGVLLIFNQLDPLQLFSTEQHDFITAMYGEMTVVLTQGRISASFHGRNALLRPEHNTSFSAVGHLKQTGQGPTVRLYENVFCANSLDYASLPSCIDVIRVKVTE